MKTGRIISRRALWLLLLSAAVRVACFGGPWLDDEHGYMEQASHVRHGKFTPRWSQPPDHRIGVIYPIAASQALFGLSRASSAILPFLASMAIVLITYLMVRASHGEQAAILAGLTASFFPLNVLLAGSPLSDIPAAAMMGLAVWMAMKGHPFRAGLAIGGAHLMRESAVFILILLGIRALWRRDRTFGRTALVFLSVILLEMLLYSVWVDRPMARWLPAMEGSHHWKMMEEAAHPGWVFNRTIVHLPSMLLNPTDYEWGYFGLIGTAVLGSLFFWKRMRFYALWAVLLTLLINFWPNRIWPYVPGSYAWARELAPLIIPFSALIGIAASQLWERRSVRVLMIGMVTVHLVISLVSAAYFREWWGCLDGTEPTLGSRPGAAVYGDVLSVRELKLRTGYERRIRPFFKKLEPYPSGTIIVVNDMTQTYLSVVHGGKFPPPDISPDWKILFEKEHRTPLHAWRIRLIGGPIPLTQRAYRIVIYEVP